jgi:hypothetical protein
MSHIVGTLQTSPVVTIGPDSGAPPSAPNTWSVNFAHIAAPTGTKFLILHFQNVKLPASNRLEVDLGYETDVFTSANGTEFWTRPVNVYTLPGGLVPIRYITNGASTGSAQLDRYGRGEQHAGESGHPSISNCDVFMKDTVYAEPTYDPYWFCAFPPNWENAACVASPDVRARVARSVGMIITVEKSDFSPYLIQVSTCSVTLVDADKVLTAGHCHTPEEALSSSVTFNYQTDCGGNRPMGYSPMFYKVVEVIAQQWDGSVHDFSLLRLAVAPPGIPSIQMRPDVPGLGEQVFGVHHPNAAVKKLSIPHPGFATVIGSSAFQVNVPSNFHVSGGSSGSGLFDTAGRIVGVLSDGDPCGRTSYPGPLKYFPTAQILKDLVPTPPPPITRDVMLVFDRSGSMSLDDGTGRTKIDAARDAVSLFVHLVRRGVGNRLGLVSFSTTASAPVDFDIAPETDATQATLIGPPPFSSGKVGALAPGGATSIGEGLDAARLQFPGPGANPRAILLMTDGLQNTPRMISDVQGALGEISVHAIGFGPESSIDGALLSDLAASHTGLYTRAQGALSLLKFYAHAFGNIFEAGVLFDPEYDIGDGQRTGTPVTFQVCGEEKITITVGWDRADSFLLIQVTTPGGADILQGSPGVESASGRTWTYMRFDLPYGGERDGTWTVVVFRPGQGEFPPPPPAMRYFINVIPTGGPRLYHVPDGRTYYTGDPINPLVAIRYANGSWPDVQDAAMTLTRPDASIGNILAKAGLGPPMTQDADTIPAIQATLLALEKASGKPVVQYVDTNISLSSGSDDTNGLFESSGVYGKSMKDELTVEGNYTFHAKVTYGTGCTATREVLWTVHVGVGIDGGNTVVTTQPGGTGPDGNPITHVTATPKDRYGNYLGPGRGGDFVPTGQPGTTVTGPVTDNGDGSYTVDISNDPSAGNPGIVITQPGHPPVVVPVPVPQPEARDLYIYSVKFLCGAQDECGCACPPVRPGKYATEINIHNYLDCEAAVRKNVIPMVFAGAAVAREPRVAGVKASEKIVVPPHSAVMDDCCRLAEMLLGGQPSPSMPLTIGILEIASTGALSVTAVYTVTEPKSGSVSVEVEQIQERRGRV